MSGFFPPCATCGEVFTNRKQYVGHRCDFMDAEIDRVGVQKLEASTSTEERPQTVRLAMSNGRLQLTTSFRCPKCRCDFSNRLDLQAHSSNPSCGNVATPTPAIDSMDSPELAIGEELQSAAEGGDFWCNDCSIALDDAQQCRRHVIDYHLESGPHRNRLGCNLLMKALKSGQRAELRAVEEPGDGLVTHDCTVCDARFREKPQLLEHMADVHGNRLLYECPDCGAMFAQRAILARHLQGHAAVNNGLSSFAPVPFDCQFCGKQFSFESYYRRHLSTHTLEPYFACDICGGQFRSQGNLTLHRATHTGTELHPCPKCGKVFPYRSYLDRHFKTHASKPSECPVCNKLFVVPSHLQTHVAVEHSDDANFACPICGRKFLYASYLERHLNTHTRAKDHACPFCQRQFAHRSALLVHVQRHLPESNRPRPRIYQCKFCANSFTNESFLEKHLQRKHIGVDVPDARATSPTTGSAFSRVPRQQGISHNVVID